MSYRRCLFLPLLAFLTVLAVACTAEDAESVTGGEATLEPVAEHVEAVASEPAARQGWLTMTTVIVSAAGGAFVSQAAVLATRRLSDRSERRRLRRDVLRKLAGHRYLLIGDTRFEPSEFWVALNEVIVAFMDDEGVMNAQLEFRSHLGPQSKAEHLVPLVKAMAKAANLPVERLNTEELTYELTHPFTPPSRGKGNTPSQAPTTPASSAAPAQGAQENN